MKWQHLGKVQVELTDGCLEIGRAGWGAADREVGTFVFDGGGLRPQAGELPSASRALLGEGQSLAREPALREVSLLPPCRDP